MKKYKSNFIEIHEGKRWRKLGNPVQQGKPFHLKTSERDEIIYLERIDGDNYRVVGTDEEMVIPGIRNNFY